MPIQRTFSDPIFMNFYDHYCPICSSRMEKIKCSGFVDSWSEEAKNFNLSSGDTRLFGTVKLIWDELRCPVCEYQISSKEMIKLERQENVNEQGTKRRLSSLNPIYIYFRRHNCPKCRSKLVIESEAIVNKQTDGSNHFKIAMSETRFVKNVVLERKVFECPECSFSISLSSLLEYELNHHTE